MYLFIYVLNWLSPHFYRLPLYNILVKYRKLWTCNILSRTEIQFWLLKKKKRKENKGQGEEREPSQYEINMPKH